MWGKYWIYSAQGEIIISSMSQVLEVWSALAWLKINIGYTQHKCQKYGHFARDYQQGIKKEPAQQMTYVTQLKSRRSWDIVCFNCSRRGSVFQKCPRKSLLFCGENRKSRKLPSSFEGGQQRTWKHSRWRSQECSVGYLLCQDFSQSKVGTHQLS